MLELYVLIFSIIIAILLTFRELKKNYVFFILLNLLGIIGAIIFEYPLIRMGLWEHMVYPQLLGVSLYACLMYIPWITIAYSISKKISKRYIYISYFLIGAFLGFFIDLISVNLHFYKYNFNSIFRIFNVPIEMTIIEGIVIMIFLILSEKIILYFLSSYKHIKR